MCRVGRLSHDLSNRVYSCTSNPPESPHGFSQTVREQDLISLMLVALALASLAAAAVPGARPVGLAIPDHLLERVRGTNPMTIQQSEGSCTGINVNTANSPLLQILPTSTATEAARFQVSHALCACSA